MKITEVADDFSEFDEPSKTVEPKKTETKVEGDYQSTLNELDSEYGSKECSFNDVEDIGKTIISTLKPINMNKLRSEMNNMSVEIFENPTTFQLAEAMAKVQEFKNRLSEIMNDVEHEYLVRKRVNDMLFDANQAVSKQSSADKRRGEATIRYPMLLLQFENINSFRTEVTNVMNNMRSIGDTVSRQASILNMQISLGEYRKKLPVELQDNGEATQKVDYKSGVPSLEWEDVN
jgi:hypothetical protein